MPRRRDSVSPEPRRRYDYDDDTNRTRDRRRRKESDVEPERDSSSANHITPRRQSSREKNRDVPDRQSSSSSQTYLTSPRKLRMSTGDDARRVVSSPPLEKRESMPYPSFSKQHSREAVTNENINPVKVNVYTPDSTDISQAGSPGGPGRKQRKGYRTTSDNRPPSPPLTARSSNGSAESNGQRYTVKPVTRPETYRRSFEDILSKSRPLRPSGSDIVLQRAEEGRSGVKVDLSPQTSPRKQSRLNEDAARSPRSQKSSRTPICKEEPTRRSRAGIGETRSRTDSDATIGATKSNNLRPPVPVSQDEQFSLSDASSPRTPDIHDRDFYHDSSQTKARAPMKMFEQHPIPHDLRTGLNSATPTMTPGRPPPPPDHEPAEIPRVDYLLQNGGLPHLIPRSFAAVSNPASIQPHQQYTSPQPGGRAPNPMGSLFSPYHSMLEDLERIMMKNGSIAVATGYRSVARRLLDRLEHVFSRNISSEVCSCIMCTSWRQSTAFTAEDTGVSWGEVLELVSGRAELPQWPPFSLPTATTAPGILNMNRLEKPMQKLDIDIPEEYRDHYVRQSQKTKNSVQKWLAHQPEEQTEPPSEVDDETLTFAILTYLEPSQQSTFAALMRGSSSTSPSSRTPTPLQSQYGQAQTEAMAKVSIALQRLYRLPQLPRNPESAVYLLKHPSLHNALTTISAISNAEWDILISGRFDGFLCSGAEEASPLTTPSHIQSPLSRTTTPLSPPLRSPTPALSSSGIGGGIAPVALDEETELAVLAEVEREIYSGMDALEDAFQALHFKAEAVRTALQHRHAGLAMQARLRQSQSQLEGDAMARAETPGGIPSQGGKDGYRDSPWDTNIANGAGFGNGVVDDDGMSGILSLAPDDSASNIGWRRREERKLRERERRPRDGGVAGKGKRWFGFGLGSGSGSGRARVDVVREEEE